MNTTASISTKGQVTIPVSIRNRLSIKAFDKLSFSTYEDTIIAKPVRDNFLSLYGSIKSKKKPVDFKKVRKLMIKKIAEHIVSKDKK